MKIRKTFLIMLMFIVLFIMASIYIVSSSYNVQMKIKRETLTEESFAHFIGEEILTEKIFLKIEDVNDYYNIDYYIEPIFFMPFKKFKVSKDYIEVINKSDVNAVRYECLSLIKFKNIIPVERDINKYYDHEIINHKNKTIDIDKIKKRCISHD